MKTCPRFLSLPAWIHPCVVVLACLATTGCHRLPGMHESGMFTPSHSRDEAIRKKAAKDPFAAEGQPISDTVPTQQAPSAPNRPAVRVR